MANKHLFILIATVYWAIVGPRAWAITDDLEVLALQDLYRSLDSPMQLEHWKPEGGDPCGEPWTGVQCYGSSIINLKLHGLGLNGSLSLQLSSLKSLEHLDLSANNIEGSIPYGLPPNLTNLNLAENKFSQSLSYSFEKMEHLRHLNLSHNFLTGPLGDVFYGLEDLKLLDLSFNNITGDLPTSFESLTNLTGLFLQNNQFTGSVIFLANLSLSNLNIEDNHFSGVIPEHFQTIPNLRIGGNKFHTGPDYPPWKFPSDIMPTENNISSPPSTNLSAFENPPPQTIEAPKKKKTSTAASIVPLIGGVIMVAALLAALAIIYRTQWYKTEIIRSPEGSDQESLRSLPIGTVHGIHYASMSAHDSPRMSSISSSPMITPSSLPPIRTKTLKVAKRKSFCKISTPIGAKAYTVAELQFATNGFGEDNLIGEGSLGSVYRAEFPDGTVKEMALKILAVKNIKTVPLSIIEEKLFVDVIEYASRLRHPNIVTLVGFCVEHTQHLILYQFIKSVSLNEALHCFAYKPLSWGIRLRIALGIARALNYIHSSFVPPVAHSNLKAANILLDEDLMPRVCDCGLASLRPLASNSVKVKASEMAIADNGYIAPEHVQPGNGNIKADVYAFGVLLLELLTGRKPFDSSRPKSEQSLVRWASSRLHDSASLVLMVDPTITRTVSSKSVSCYADIVSMCIQSEQEFRPPMSEIVESLTSLLQKPAGIDYSPIGAKAYTVAELQFATNSFGEDNLIGEGSLGSRAEFPHGTLKKWHSTKTMEDEKLGTFVPFTPSPHLCERNDYDAIGTTIMILMYGSLFTTVVADGRVSMGPYTHVTDGGASKIHTFDNCIVSIVGVACYGHRFLNKLRFLRSFRPLASTKSLIDDVYRQYVIGWQKDAMDPNDYRGFPSTLAFASEGCLHIIGSCVPTVVTLRMRDGTQVEVTCLGSGAKFAANHMMTKSPSELDLET